MKNELKAADLRIGNLTLNEKGSIYKVSWLDNTINGQLKPIPLTEEWLERFGFEKRESSTCKNWYIGTNTITHDWLFDVVWLLKPELIDAPNYPFYRNGRHLIQYVHHLQNLYHALTGEELTLKTQ